MGSKKKSVQAKKRQIRRATRKLNKSFSGDRFESLEERTLLTVDFIPLPLGGLTPNRTDQALGLSNSTTQPSIALSPEDPGLFSVANESQLLFSSNAGNTFIAGGNFQAILGTGATANGSADLVYTADGELKWAEIKTAAGGTQSIGVTFSAPGIFGVTTVPTNVGASVVRPIVVSDNNEADDSPYAGYLYVSFTDTTDNLVMLSRSVDGGLNWTTPIAVSSASETTTGTFEPVTLGSVTVGPNGDVYVAYHYQPGSTAVQGADGESNSDGASGQVFVRRSTDGGLSFVSKTTAFPPGEADISFNVQTAEAAIPRARFWNHAARQPTILADPVREGHVYVVAADDPDNLHGTGDEGNIVFARSDDFGQTWDRRTIDIGTGTTFQTMPQAEIDEFGNIILGWYDSRLNQFQGDLDFRLHVFSAHSVDGGSTWSAPIQVSDDNNPIDPVTPTTTVLFPGGDLDGDGRVEDDSDETYSLGNYFDIEAYGGTAYFVWNGNTRTIGIQSGHQVFYDVYPIYGTLEVTGLDTDDQFLVRAMPDNPEYVEVFINGDRKYAGLMESLKGGIQFHGLGGNDTLIVDYETSDANPVPTGGLFFQGDIPEGGNDVGDTINLLTGDRSVDFQNETSDLDGGLFVVGDSAAISFDNVERTQVQSVDFLRPDELEPNDTLATATELGSEVTVTLTNLTIHDTGEASSNDDFYRITAHQTGMMVVNAIFATGEGDNQDPLEVTILDSNGQEVATGSGRLVIPVVGQESYAVKINGVDGGVNRYALEIENFSAPAPLAVFIDPNDDSGMMNNDAVTASLEPRILVQADLTSLTSQGIAVLSAAEATAGDQPGAGLFVQLLDQENGAEILSGYASALDGDLFEFNTRELPEGQFTVTASVHIFDPGNIVGPSQNATAALLTIDSISPAITSPQMLPSSDSGMNNQDNVTNIMQPAFVGVTEPNAKVRVLANGNIVGETVAGTDGRWEVTIEPLTQGIYDITSQAQDIAGNFGESETLNRIEVDKTAPNTPFLDLTPGSDTGLSNSDNVTGDNTLTFTMTTTDGVDHLNEENLKYRLYVRPEGGAETLVFNSFDNGGFTSAGVLSATLDALPDGTHNFKLEVEDRAGNISEDFLLDVTIDISLPGSLTIDLSSASDTGMDDSDNVTNFSRPTFTGTGEVGAAVNLFANGQLAGTGTVAGDASDGTDGDGRGAWEITAGSLDDGIYQVTATTVTDAGASSTEALTVEVDTLQPNTPLLDLIPRSDTGHSNYDNITSQITPTFNMATLDPGQDGHLNEFNYKYRLFVRVDSGPENLLYDSVGDPLFPGSASDGVFTNLENLRRTLTLGLPDGVHNFKLEVEDRAGNISEDFLLNVNVDTTLALPNDGLSLDLATLADTGMDGRDNTTKINEPTFVGVAEVGSEVTLIAEGIVVGTAVVGSDETDFNPNDGLGTFQVTSAALADGQHEFIVHVEDWAGNFERSEPLVVDIDTTPPNTPFLDLVGGVNLGLGTEASFSDDLTFTMTTEDPDSGDRANEFNYKFRIYQRAAGTEEELIYDSVNDSNIPAENRQGGFTDLRFLQTAIENLPAGQHNFKLEVEDRAGNMSHDYLLTVVLLEELPIDALTIDLLNSSDTGMSENDDVTNKDQPVFNGVATVGTEVRLLSADDIIGVGRVGGDASNGVLGDGLGTWEITAEPLDDGVYTVQAEIEDDFGNTARTASLTFEVDTIAPNTPQLDLLPADDTGLSSQDNVTSNLLPTFNMATLDSNKGTHLSRFNFKYRLFVRLDSGVERLVYNSAEDDSFTASAFQDGFTSLENLRRVIDLGVPDGVHNFKLEVEDRAGNISEDYLLNVTVDTVLDAPDGVVTIDLGASADSGMSDRDDVTNINRPTFNGVAEVGARVSIIANGQLIGSGVVGSDETDFTPGDGLGAWEVTVQPLDDGQYDVLTHIEDLAGNFLRSESIQIEVDTAQPNTPLLDLLDDSGHSDHDNITDSSSPNFSLTTTDPSLPDGNDRNSNFNLKYRVYLRPEGGEESLLYNSVVDSDIDAANISGGFTDLNQILTALGPFPDGTHNLKLEVEDRAGNVSEDFLLTFEVDTVLDGNPTLDLIDASDSGMASDDNVTNVSQPTFSGVGEVGSAVRLFANGVFVGTAEIQSDLSDGTLGDGLGLWEISSRTLVDGEYEMTAQIEDWAGNITTTAGLSIEIDTAQPNTPLLDLLSDTGHSDHDNFTGESALEFNMTTEDSGVHGNEFNLKYRLFLRPEGGQELLFYNSVEDDSVAGQGGFTNLNQITTTLSELPDGNHNFKLEVEDRAGNVSEDFLLDVTIDTSLIGPPTIDMLDASDTGISETDDVTGKDQPAFSGVGEAGSTVRLFANGELVGVGEVQSDLSDGIPGDGLGLWEITSEPLDDGVYEITAQVEDWADNLEITSPLAIEVDTIAPNTPQLDLLPADDTGFSSQDNVTSNLLPTFNMATLDTNKGSHLSSFNFNYRLFLRLDSGVERLAYDSSTDTTFTPSAFQEGLTSLENLRRQIDLAVPDGVHNFKLEVEDRAGNISEDFWLDVTIDTFLDTIEADSDNPTVSIDLSATADTGMSDRDDVTKINTPTFTGIAEVGAMVTLVANGQVIGTGTVGSDETDFSPGDGLGAWEVQTDALDDGEYSALAHIEDLAGNFLRSNELTINIDTTEPNTPYLDLLNDTGHSHHDNITEDNELNFNFTTTDPALPDGSDRISEFNLKYRIYLRPEAGGEQLIYNSVTDTGIDAGNILGGFTDLDQLQTTLGPFPDGIHNFKLEVEDRAGNISQDFLLTVEVDTDLEGEPGLDMLDSSDSGMFDDDNVTGINQPAFDGVGEVGSTVRLFANGRMVGVAEVQSDKSDGTPDDGLGLWEITSEPLDDGTYQMTAQIEDWAGNIETTGALTIEVDTLQPNTPLLDLIPASDSGLSESDNVTNEVVPNFNMATQDPNNGDHISRFNYKYRLFVRLDSGAESLIYNSAEDGSNFTPSSFQDGFTSLENLRRAITQGVPDGVHNFKLEVEDRAGNISEDFLLDVKIDTTLDAPDQVITIDMISSSDTGMSETDNVTNKDQPAVSGVAEVGAMVTILSAGRVVGTAVVGSDETDLVPDDGFGAWEVTVEPLDDGIHELTAHVEDLAGNFLRSEALTIEVDTQAPNTPFLDLVSDSDTGLDGRDEVTNDNTLSFNMTTTDGAPDGHLIDENFKFRLYVRPEGSREILAYDSVTDPELLEDLRNGLTDFDFLQKTLGALPDGTHNFKLEVEDRAGNISEDFLLNVTIDTSLVDPTIDLIPSSDTGMFDNDDVTNKDQPAFAGVGDVGDRVSLFANGVLVGTGFVGSDLTDFVPGNGRGAWEITSEPLDDGVHSIIAHIEDDAGNFQRTTPIEIEVDTLEPNTPHLDLVTSSDTGHSPHDNITGDRTPTFTFTTQDPNANIHFSDFNLKYRLFVRPEGGEEVLIYNSVVDPEIDVANIENGFVDLNLIETTLAALPDGIHNFKLEVEDRAGNISHDVTLDVEIDATLPDVGQIDMLVASDTGMSDIDNVTNKDQPAFQGLGTPGTLVRLRANGELVGSVEVGSDESDGIIGNDLGVWEITSEPLDEGVYTMDATFEDWAGNISTSNSLQIEVDTLAPNTPFLDLLESDDSGRHDDDNITNATVVSFSATTEDPNTPNHIALTPDGQNLKYRIFVRPESGQEVLIYDSTADNRLSNKLDGLISLNRITANVPNLPEGLHNFKLEVEDRAGNISEDYLLNVLVDRTPFQGTIELHPASDTGIWGIASTFGDGITGNSFPTFTGTAEANNIVTLFIDGIQAGQTVVTPFDGDDAFTTGQWEITSGILLADGVHTVSASFQDPAGNITVNDSDIVFVVDTTGPRIQNITRADFGFTSLFDPKPAGGPDPLIDSIVVHFADAPARPSEVPYGAVLAQLALEEGNYRLVGDANGNIAITDVQILSEDDGPGIATTAVRLFFAEPLPDDRFTFTVFDRIADAAGNPLDGDSGANGPFEGNPGLNATSPIFPTGDGNHGGDFLARFTIDSRPEIGVWAAGSVYVDTNGNFLFDPNNQDFVNRDITYAVGFTSDDIFAGNFAGFNGQTDGYDKLAAYGRYGGWVDGTFRWLVDLDNDGVVDIDVEDPADVNGLPVAGNFDLTNNGDEVALFTGDTWHFDTNGDYLVDTELVSELRGYPAVGDFDGDGFDDLATWTDDTYTVDLANGTLSGWDGVADTSFRFGFIGVRERPVVADMDQDGFDDMGLWVPDRGGITPRETGEWYWLVSNGNSVLDRIVSSTDPVRGNTSEIQFRPTPFGKDIFAQFGDEFAIPVVGNFDPPTLGSLPPSRIHTNPDNALDVNGDGDVSPIDALITITHINDWGPSSVDEITSDTDYLLDVTGDGFVSAVDALAIILRLNELNAGSGEPDGLEVEIAARDAALAATFGALDSDIDEDE